MEQKETSVMDYRNLFERLGIHHSNSGLQMTHAMYINGYFMLIFYFTPDRVASEGRKSHTEDGNIRIQLKLNKPLPEAITCLLYIEHHNCVLVDFSRNVTTDLTERLTPCIYCALCVT